MPSDLGKAALIAAIAMAISDLWSVAVIADAMEGPIADRAMIWLICPLLGQAIEPQCWLVACLYSVLVCAISFYVFTRARPRIAYWV